MKKIFLLIGLSLNWQLYAAQAEPSPEEIDKAFDLLPKVFILKQGKEISMSNFEEAAKYIMALSSLTKDSVFLPLRTQSLNENLTTANVYAHISKSINKPTTIDMQKSFRKVKAVIDGTQTELPYLTADDYMAQMAPDGMTTLDLLMLNAFSDPKSFSAIFLKKFIDSESASQGEILKNKYTKDLIVMFIISPFLLKTENTWMPYLQKMLKIEDFKQAAKEAAADKGPAMFLNFLNEKQQTSFKELLKKIQKA